MWRARPEERADVLLIILDEGFASGRSGSRRDAFRHFPVGFRTPNDGVDGWSRLEGLFSAAGLREERLGVFAGAVVWEW